MPLYHFNLHNTETIFDVEGTDLPNDEAAQEHAVAVARELMFRNRSMFDKAWSRYKMSVVDVDGNEILSFAMSEVGGAPQ